MRELEEYKAAEEIRNMKTGRALGELKAQNDYEKVQIERKIEMADDKSIQRQFLIKRIILS